LPGLTMGSSKLVQPPIYPAAKSALKDFHLRESCTEQNGQCAVFFLEGAAGYLEVILKGKDFDMRQPSQVPLLKYTQNVS